MTWLRRADPLVLFLIAGLALYLLLEAIGFGEGDDRRIRVGEAELAAFLAGRGGQSDDGQLAQLPLPERQKLLRDYVQEEALYREARALGLDKEDSAIRRRLVQSLRFSLQGDETAEQAPTDKELRAYFTAHRDRYRGDATISFVHVFFDSGRRGRAQAAADARRALARIGDGDWLAQGDRYPYQRSYSRLTRDTLAAEWGDAAAQRVFGRQHEPSLWFGPVESELGYHLVRIDSFEAASEPRFESARQAVEQDWQRDRREQRLQAAVDRIVQSYSVKLSSSLGQTLK